MRGVHDQAVSSGEREHLRATFDEVAELYDRVRPTYPSALFDDLVGLAGLRVGDRLLEIGPGTGQATEALATGGFQIVCVELGSALAARARRKLSAFPNVEVVAVDFEQWEPARAGFDAIVAFTSFHWLEPETRFARAARLLPEGGALALVETHHVLPAGGDPFRVHVQEDYDAVAPAPDNRPPGPPEEIADLADKIDASGLFRNVAARRYVSEVAYSADEYIDVLDTYAGHRALDDAVRAELYARIRGRIEARPEPTVTKTYLFTLNVARKLSA
jgi:SAM-dependent methyltransferase